MHPVQKPPIFDTPRHDDRQNRNIYSTDKKNLIVSQDYFNDCFKLS
jgi:hypothetical protein